MTREEYLSALKNEIMALSSEEQAEALQYYSDYFEEAGDDKKVMEELGSPEELAKTITEKFANAIVKTVSPDYEGSCNGDDNISSDNILFYSFSRNDVRNLDFSFGAAEVVFIKGKKYSLETRGMDKNDLKCHLSSAGTLTVANTKRVCFNFFSHNRDVNIVPRILVTIPDNVSLGRFALKVGAGSFRCKDVELHCDTGNVEVGAGNLVLGGIYGGEINFRCGMGNLEFTGAVTGISNVDCGMGSLKLVIDGYENDYSYDLRLGFGEFKINDKKQGGIYQNINNPKKSNHFSVNCGMGSVNIKITKK